MISYTSRRAALLALCAAAAASGAAANGSVGVASRHCDASTVSAAQLPATQRCGHPLARDQISHMELTVSLHMCSPNVIHGPRIFYKKQKSTC